MKKLINHKTPNILWISPAMDKMIDMFTVRGIDENFDFSVRSVYPNYYNKKPVVTMIINDGGESNRRAYQRFRKNTTPMSILSEIALSSKKHKNKYPESELVIVARSTSGVKIQEKDLDTLNGLMNKIIGYNSWHSSENRITLDSIYSKTPIYVGVFKKPNFDTIMPLIPSLQGNPILLMNYPGYACNTLQTTFKPCKKEKSTSPTDIKGNCKCYEPELYINSDFAEVRSSKKKSKIDGDPNLIYFVTKYKEEKTDLYTLELTMISSEIVENVLVLNVILDMITSLFHGKVNG